MAAEYITLEMASDMHNWIETSSGWRLKYHWGNWHDAKSYAIRCEELLRIPCATMQTVDGKFTVHTSYRPDSRT